MDQQQAPLLDSRDVEPEYERTPSGTYWRHFSPDTPRPQARLEYIRIYGRPPAQVLRVPNMILAGPVPGPVEVQS